MRGLLAVNNEVSRITPQAVGCLPVYGQTCSCVATQPVDCSNGYTGEQCRHAVAFYR